MATDTFLKPGDVKGESTDDKHRDEIEVLAFSWGMSQPGSMSGGGRSAGKVTFQDLHCKHSLDKASPNIMKACATGEHIKEAVLTVRRPNRTPQEYLIISMSGVIVRSVAPDSSGGEAARIPENFTLSFAKVDLEYKPQKPDGSLDAGAHFKYDIKGDRKKAGEIG